ncbi:hypothetical protein JAK62_00315 [Stenotrophomonas maltophilia]|uniref:hypothetical protein n=1 Tax=Stenotrophomonas maltophilia TaxID=40324 RepID=UPI00111029FF|nr:hypothetical protein [Stenotrophomonas maltophilia]MBH1371979.1 hypothetical protein [Stenotrophomonas maltophilia]MBH1750366.1 hypothetical protein [Stenotrophomonas maltophilia]MCF3458081.1 hypothetical protein [Stenotrophomonas maltophilia]MCF3543523.1 hypothetical protein [Stenotrophomonas maltophilia]MCO7497926.1 hypothetical protein [Stenotrophomonas maltophilia]
MDQTTAHANLQHARTRFFVAGAAYALLTGSSSGKLILEHEIVFSEAGFFVNLKGAEKPAGNARIVSFNRATEKDEAAALLQLAFQKVLSDSVDTVRAYARHIGEWESLKKEHWFAFAHHLRNAFSHNGRWHFERHAVVPVQWRRYSIDRSMQGESASAFLSHYDGTELMAQMILYVSGIVDYRQIHIPKQPCA